ncbi:hypothetical protein FKP32DRAFT_341641 [Trametes sanguinea]|nr:hypothetical protein FKP32DRAFT_341641 [Trametes sanguinea]
MPSVYAAHERGVPAEGLDPREAAGGQACLIYLSVLVAHVYLNVSQCIPPVVAPPSPTSSLHFADLLWFPVLRRLPTGILRDSHPSAIPQPLFRLVLDMPRPGTIYLGPPGPVDGRTVVLVTYVCCMHSFFSPSPSGTLHVCSAGPPVPDPFELE